MSIFMLIKICLFEGVWDGVIILKKIDGIVFVIEVMLLEKLLDYVMLILNGDNCWILCIFILFIVIVDGVYIFLICEKFLGEMLESFLIIVGEVVVEDICVEMDLLWVELDMFKCVFCCYCVEMI